MDEEEINEEIEREERAYYRLGIRNQGKTIDCPWCGRHTFKWGELTGYYCDKCEYTPGADLRGGQFS